MNSHQDVIIRALNAYRSDDLYRAHITFRKFTPAQMQQEYYGSGKTCQEVLDEYESRDRVITNAINWVKYAV